MNNYNEDDLDLIGEMENQIEDLIKENEAQKLEIRILKQKISQLNNLLILKK